MLIPLLQSVMGTCTSPPPQFAPPMLQTWIECRSLHLQKSPIELRDFCIDRKIKYVINKDVIFPDVLLTEVVQIGLGALKHMGCHGIKIYGGKNGSGDL